MARFDPARSNNTVGRFYEGKGTFRTAMEIVKQRGYVGLWSGFRLHMGKLRLDIGLTITLSKTQNLRTFIQSAIRLEPPSTS
jgi:hypothetical protein